MKYIMFIKKDKMASGGTLTHLAPVLFPDFLVHADIAEALMAGPLEGYKVDSAGERSSLGGDCHGESTTLKKKSKARDSQIVNMCDYGRGHI